VAFGTLLLGILGLSVMASTGDVPSREIRLEAREMAFYLPGNPTPNPDLRLHRGEVVRLVLINRDLGLRHDLSVEELDVRTELVVGDGSATEVILRAPRQRGSFDYVCSLHRTMMRGVVVVDS
jgi:hypothetical protein